MFKALQKMFLGVDVSHQMIFSDDPNSVVEQQKAALNRVSFGMAAITRVLAGMVAYSVLFKQDAYVEIIDLDDQVFLDNTTNTTLATNVSITPSLLPSSSPTNTNTVLANIVTEESGWFLSLFATTFFLGFVLKPFYENYAAAYGSRLILKRYQGALHEQPPLCWIDTFSEHVTAVVAAIFQDASLEEQEWLIGVIKKNYGVDDVNTDLTKALETLSLSKPMVFEIIIATVLLLMGALSAAFICNDYNAIWSDSEDQFGFERVMLSTCLIITSFIPLIYSYPQYFWLLSDQFDTALKKIVGVEQKAKAACEEPNQQVDLNIPSSVASAQRFFCHIGLKEKDILLAAAINKRDEAYDELKDKYKKVKNSLKILLNRADNEVGRGLVALDKVSQDIRDQVGNSSSDYIKSDIPELLKILPNAKTQQNIIDCISVLESMVTGLQSDLGTKQTDLDRLRQFQPHNEQAQKEISTLSEEIKVKANELTLVLSIQANLNQYQLNHDQYLQHTEVLSRLGRIIQDLGPNHPDLDDINKEYVDSLYPHVMTLQGLNIMLEDADKLLNSYISALTDNISLREKTDNINANKAYFQNKLS